MYEATNKERAALVLDYNYNPQAIDMLDIESDKVRRGIPIDMPMAVITYQTELQAVRKSLKRWWQFWK